MLSTTAHNRFRFVTAALVGLMACAVTGIPGRAEAATAGGTAPPGTTANSPASTLKRASGTSSAHVTTVRITGVACMPAAKCSTNPHQVSTHGIVLLKGKGLKAGMVVAFPSAPGGRIRPTSPGAHLRSAATGLIATVPNNAHSGHIQVLLSKGRHTSSYGPIYVYTHALHPPPPTVPPLNAGAAGGTAFTGQGMWIWYVSKSGGGTLASIVAQAHAAGVSTVFVKSSDGGSNYWSQFSAQLVAELHANGLKVCAWQYVYGTNPAGEANLGAEAVANGADCLVIDAEAEYEGHYAAAQTYIADLRAKVGVNYPVGLASFPYVSLHPSFPYSVFLGPNGAQYNAPQMYWKAIGTSVDTVYANTWIANRIYGRGIFPLGQTYEGVSASDVLRFREEASAYGAPGVSFWDWQETPASLWSTLAVPLAPLTSVLPNTTFPVLKNGSRGDQVLWMQEHLATAVPTQETTGKFASETEANLITFQTAHGIPPSGVTDAATWAALLALPPIAVDWTGSGPSGD